MLHSVDKQAYKLKLAKKWRVHNMFHVLLLEQDTIKKERVNEKVLKLDAGNKDSKEYEVEAIWDSAVYTNELKSGHLPGLYYLVAWKGYSKEKNTWKPLSAVQHLKKLINSFHKDHPEKPTATSPPIDSAPPMVKPTVKPTAKATTKQKQGRLANRASKQAKKWIYMGFCDNQPLIRQRLDGLVFFSPKFFIFSNLIYKSVGFPPQSHLIRLEGFFLPSTVYQTIFPITRFSLLSFHWVKRFFHQQISFDLFFSFPTELRGFLYQTAIGFLPRSLIGLGDFLSSYK